MRKKWQESDYQFIRENYRKLSNNEIADKLNCSKRALGHTIIKLGCGTKKRGIGTDNLNECFFDSWSEPMAYILGFTMADGCVYDDYRFGYGVNSKDKNLLEYISNVLYGKNLVKDSLETRNDKMHPTSRLRISCKKIVEKLLEYNIFPRKTGREELPNIPDEFKPHYLRGLFDGDGCITLSTPTQNVFHIVSASQKFLENVKKYLGFNYGYIRRKDTCWCWYVYTQSQIKDLKNYMYYKNYSFALERKRIRFL